MTELDIFAAACEINDPDARANYLAEACGDNKDLRTQIEQLLKLADKDDSFMEHPSWGAETPQSQESLNEVKVGSQIGPYKLKEKIGEGGMGIVFVADQKQPVERRVALKIIKPGMDSRQVIARFEVERQALAMMDHPNIAKVLDAGTTEQGLPYFVMELVNGLPITQYCDDQQLTVRQRLDLYVSVCEGVQHAHQKGIIHRDLKPSNILVAMYDGRPVPKVIDFGVAKATGQSLGDFSIYTQLGQIVGTLEYMSPEQAQRNQLDIDTRADIYSLGVVLYELLAGATPFDKERLRNAAMDELLRIIGEEEPPKPSTKVSSSQSLPSIAVNRKTEPTKLGSIVRGELDWIVMKAMDKNRSRRYETANGFSQDIKRYLTNEPVQACPPSARYRFEKLLRRNRVAVMTSGIVAVLLIVGTTVSAWQAVRATRAQNDANTYLARSREQEQLTNKANTELKETLSEVQNAKRESDEERARAEHNFEFIRQMLLSSKFRGNKATVQDLLYHMAEELDKSFADDPKSKAKLMYTICQANFNNVDERLLKYARRCIECCSEAYGPDSVFTIFASSQLFHFLGMSEAEEVEDFLVDLARRSEKSLGENHRVTITCDLELVEFYSGSNRYYGTPGIHRPENAIEILENLDRVVQGPVVQHADNVGGKWSDDKHTDLRILLAQQYQKVGRGAKATELLEQETNMIRKADRFDSNTARYAFYVLADIYRQEGDTEKAIEFMESFIGELKAADKEWVNAEIELSQICYDAGELIKAIEHVKNVYRTDKIQEFLADPLEAMQNTKINPDWAINYVVDRLCVYQRELWKRNGDEKLLKQAIEIYRELLPATETARSRSGLTFQYVSGQFAKTLAFSNQIPEATDLLQESIDYFRSVTNVYRLNRLNPHLARCLIELERYEQAIPILEECLEWEKKQFEGKTKEHINTGREGYGQVNKHYLAYAKFKLGQTEPELEPLLIEGAEFAYGNLTLPDLPAEYAKEIHDEFHWSRKKTIETIERVINYYTAQETQDSIAKWRSRLDEIQQMPIPDPR